ncbi:MAG: type IV pilin [Methanoregula sp.]|nr:type IV pilin [Methanoregula sp.]
MKNKEQSRPLNERGALKKECDNAVSPVVGVMLMLVVVVIIAAIVSGFSGGLVGGNNQKAPTLNMDVKIANSGSYRSTELSATVNGLSEPIPTKDLKIITSWTTTVKQNYYIDSDAINKNSVAGTGCIVNRPNGTVYHGGAEVIPGITNSCTGRTPCSVAPYGFGPGVENSSTSDLAEGTTGGAVVPEFNWQAFTVTHFGNYSLQQGTVMMAEAGGRCLNWPMTGGIPDTYDMGGYGSKAGQTVHPYTYVTGNFYRVYSGSKTTPQEILTDNGEIDGMQALLGCGWENLRAGDIVNMKVVHLPSGKTIFDKNIVVSPT